MPADLYDDEPAASPPSKPAPEEEQHQDEGGETALLPSSICPGMKPGDEMVLKIVSVQDDQYQVAYAPEKGSKESGEGEGEGSMAGATEAGMGAGASNSLYD